MDADDLRRRAESLRTARPGRALRGFDEGETRKLLDEAADALDALARDQEGVQGELERLRAAADEETAGRDAIGAALIAANRAGEEVVAAAKASAARITAEAEAEAEAIREQARADAASQAEQQAAARVAFEQETAAARAESELELERLRAEQEGWQARVETERKRLREEVEAEAQHGLDGKRDEVARLERQAQKVRAALAERQRRLVAVARSTLEKLDGLEAAANGSGETDLLEDLHPGPSEAEAEQSGDANATSAGGESADGSAPPAADSA